VVNQIVKFCLSISAVIAVAIFVVTMHAGGRAAELNFFQLLGIACAVQVVGYFALAFYFKYLFQVRLRHKEAYLKRAKAYKLVAGLIMLIGLSACAGGAVLIFR